MKELHRLLRRQVKKSGLNPETCEQLSMFLTQINDAYISFDNDLQHIEGVLEKSSQELYQANKKLQSNVDSLSDELTRIASNIQEVIFEVDIDGYWSYLNPTWEQMTGLKVEDCLGQPFLKFVKQSTGLPLIELIKFMNSKLEKVNESICCTVATGEKKWLNLTMKAIHDEKGSHKGFIGSIRDNTDLKMTEDALIEAKNKALKANKAKDDFLSTMSHEIRTPLNAVIGMSHLLLLEDPKQSQLKNLNALKYSSEHLLGLVNDILDFNKIASESLELEEIDFNLSYVINGLNSIFSGRAKEKDIRFIVKKDSDIPDMVKGDSTRFTQILTNLIGNAIKFTDEGKVILDIELASETEEYLVLDFAIQDTGIGIPEDKVEKVFESFAQADSDTTRKYGGTGLGLAICKKLLEIMGSDLQLESTYGKGSTFYFSIYMKKSEVEISKEINPNSSWIDDNKKDLKGARILVAEDNKINILVIKQFLDKWNVDYDIAENGLIAIEKAMNKNYNLVLMDLQMPEMNGFDASKTIRESSNPLNKVIPIYALSASTGIDIRNQLSEYGLNGLLAKPFDPNELYQTIADIVNGSNELKAVE